ncbi:hypothetical protein OAJ03_00680 [Candidatus Pelagibacter sp.]|nr:hypothetical protein [Candidatus Pelagibacter sp.]
MQIKKKLNKLNNLYIIFFSTLLFINIFFVNNLNANSFKITSLEISEPFELNFNKQKVIDKGFREAFLELISKITTTGDKRKIEKTSLKTIKKLIDSFTMSNERFVNNEYKVNFDVNFNKKNTLVFFEKKNIFPSIPKAKDLLLIPVLVDVQKDEIFLFNKNIFYEKWNKNSKRYFLLNYLLPSEDIEDVNLFIQNSTSIEDYNFEEIVTKYDLKDFIITILYRNNNDVRILSKIRLNNTLKIDNQKFTDIESLEDIDLLINDLKNIYENYWKNINQINTSIKLPLTIFLNSKKYKKIQVLENTLNEIDLVSNYEITKFDSENIFFKIIYNGSPNKFIDDMKDKNIEIITKYQTWTIE